MVFNKTLEIAITKTRVLVDFFVRKINCFIFLVAQTWRDLTMKRKNRPYRKKHSGNFVPGFFCANKVSVKTFPQ
jgi:hypothetical protein